MVLKIKQFIKRVFPGLKETFLAALLGLAFANVIYLGLLQRHFFSRRYLFYAFLIAGFGMLFSAWLNKTILIPKIRSFSKSIRIFILLFSLLLSIILLFNTDIQPIYYLLPDSSMDINFSIGGIPEGEEGVRLLWIETGQGYVHFTHLDYDGEWERVFGNTIFPPKQTVSLKWKGKVGPHVEIAFRQTKFDQSVSVKWNDQQNTYQLNYPDLPIIFIRNRFKVPIIFNVPFILSFMVSIAYGIFALLTLLGSWEITQPRKSASAKYYWLRFMLPMLIFWAFSLMVFWPGIMSNDSLAQWRQGVQGNFNDWQSAFHSFSLAILMRIWYSPAFIASIQIVLLALTAAWGLKTLEEYGVPNLILWALSVLLAIFPPNAILSITLWKDIPYAISFLLLTNLLLCIVLSGGEWGKNKFHWIWVGAAAFLVSIFRQNGAAVALISLLLLPMIFRKYWKTYAGSLIIALLLYLVVKGPLYSAINVDNKGRGQSNLIYLHHIAAHVEAGTELKDTERAYLNSFLPLEDWNYSCCYVGVISYNPDFERGAFLSNTAENRMLALNLFMRDPFVDISHAFCAGELAWKFENNRCYMKSTHGINSWRPGKEDWIIPNDVSLNEASLLPVFIQPYVQWLRRFGFLDDMLVSYLRPALWLYLAAFSLAVLVVRRNDFRTLLPGIPAFSQSAVLLLVGFAPAFRYYYGTCLVGILLLGCIFIPKHDEN